jgi:hypothetical protein
MGLQWTKKQLMDITSQFLQNFDQETRLIALGFLEQFLNWISLPVPKICEKAHAKF